MNSSQLKREPWQQQLEDALCTPVQHQVLLPPEPEDDVCAKNITCLEGKNIMPGSTVCTPVKTNSGNGLSNWYCGIIKSHFPVIHLSEVQWSSLCLFAVISIMWSYDLLTSGSSKA